MDFRRLLRTLAASVVLALLVAALAAPPDPFTQLLSVSLLLLVFAPIGYVVDAAWTAESRTEN